MKMVSTDEEGLESAKKALALRRPAENSAKNDNVNTEEK